MKIIGAVGAALAISLAGAGSALADTFGVEGSGGGDVGLDVIGPQLPPPAPLPILPMPAASVSGDTALGVDTPVASVGTEVQTGVAVDPGLPEAPPPPAPPVWPWLSGSAETGAGGGF